MSEHTLHTPMVKRLERSRDAKILAGVAGGLGRYFDLAPAVFRLGFVVLTLLGGAGILVYIAAVLVMPKEGEESSIAEDILPKRRDHPARVVALGLVARRRPLGPRPGGHLAERRYRLVPRPRRRLVILLWTSRRRGIVVALTTFFALILVTALAAVAVAFAWFNVSLGDGVGDKTYAPTTIAQRPPDYDLGIGEPARRPVAARRRSTPSHVNAQLGSATSA